MNNRINHKIAIDVKAIAVVVLLFTTCFRWLLDGIINDYFFSLGCLALFGFFLFRTYQNRAQVIDPAAIWSTVPSALKTRFWTNQISKAMLL